MYTQCPNCATAFRVTARVLKQAAGKVRCGGCGTAFDALFFLTESRPESGRRKGSAGALPKWTGGPDEDDAAGLPSVSAEQKAEFLKTLDELAGPDIRLEDTGIEWRLLDDEDEEFAGDEDSDIFLALDTPVDAELSADVGAARIDELLDDAPAELDEFLTATPNRIDATEVFADSDGSAGSGEAVDDAESVADRSLRFDDDTGLPERADDEAAALETAESENDGAGEAHTAAGGEKATPADLVFGDPEEWGELLDESLFDDTLADESSEPLFEIEAEPSPDDGDSAPEDEDIPELSVSASSTGERSIEQPGDGDRLHAAGEDESGFASGLGFASTSSRIDEAWPAGKETVGIETIIMEGDTVRTVLEQEARDATSVSTSDAVASGFLEQAKQSFRGHLTAMEETVPRRRLLGIGGAIVLTLLLVGQLVHQSRAELATIPALQKVIAPLYRAVGAPITPSWDVRGWRFEVTRGSTGPPQSPTQQGDNRDTGATAASGSEGSVLTINSRVGNRSSRPLPYPLINVALTDRFEEVVGTVILEPRDYLPANIDASLLVPAGRNFNAVVSIQSPAEDATGFKLKVCYRQANDALRCATEDFR